MDDLCVVRVRTDEGDRLQVYHLDEVPAWAEPAILATHMDEHTAPTFLIDLCAEYDIPAYNGETPLGFATGDGDPLPNEFEPEAGHLYEHHSTSGTRYIEAVTGEEVLVRLNAEALPHRYALSVVREHIRGGLWHRVPRRYRVCKATQGGGIFVLTGLTADGPVWAPYPCEYPALLNETGALHITRHLQHEAGGPGSWPLYSAQQVL